MFSHIFIGVSDFDRAYSFYAPLMALLGIDLKFHAKDVPWAGWHADKQRPLFIIGKPYDGLGHQAGNGQMVAFLAPDRSLVNQFYDLAIRNGATCGGSPGLRPQYHKDYYGAYFKDLDGNKICIACHEAVGV